MNAILSDPQVRGSMNYHRAGYYHCFDVGQAVGYIPSKSGPGRWPATVTQHHKLYREETFALLTTTDDKIAQQVWRLLRRRHGRRNSVRGRI